MKGADSAIVLFYKPPTPDSITDIRADFGCIIARQQRDIPLPLSPKEHTAITHALFNRLAVAEPVMGPFFAVDVVDVLSIEADCNNCAPVPHHLVEDRDEKPAPYRPIAPQDNSVGLTLCRADRVPP